MYTKLFIRPVYGKEQQSLIPKSLALCTTNGELLVDSQILEHFDRHEPGIDIKLMAVDMEWIDSPNDIEWGNNIYVEGK
jgi:hypothetical protein